MCFHYSLGQDARNLENRYNASLVAGTTFQPVHHVNGFTFPYMPVIARNQINLFRWGLVPSWCKSDEEAEAICKLTLNAKAETIADKPSFRNAIFGQRCLVPADGFFEWQTIGNKKKPWFIRLRSTEVFSFAGIWDRWKSKSGQIWLTFSIITTQANPMMAEIHNSKKRMPVILSRPDEQKWTDPSLSFEQMGRLFLPYDENDMEAWEIGPLISQRGANTNVPEVKKPNTPPPAELKLDLFS